MPNAAFDLKLLARTRGKLQELQTGGTRLCGGRDARIGADRIDGSRPKNKTCRSVSCGTWHIL
jgi:hypothetical protein